MKLIINNFFKHITLSVFILFSSQSIAVTISDGIEAVENNDNAGAVKIWLELASSGSTIAQYNLATHYRSGDGVKKNQKESGKWLKGATRSGLIQAYLHLNSKAVMPAKGMTLSFNVDPEVWLQKQEGNKYTIQLASSRNKKSIVKAYKDNNFKGEGGYYHYARDGIDRYGLIYGTFKTVAAANKAITQLPKKLRKKTPWVRKIKSLQKISK